MNPNNINVTKINIMNITMLTIKSWIYLTVWTDATTNKPNTNAITALTFLACLSLSDFEKMPDFSKIAKTTAYTRTKGIKHHRIQS